MRLTRDEICLIAGILFALILGASVKHCREQRRLVPLASTPAPAKVPAGTPKIPPQADSE